jgi:lipopolysaccharide biosynthesis protein
MYPTLCALQNDEERLIRTFFNYLRFTLFIIFPLMIGLAVMSETLVELLLSEKWLPAAPFMSILCIAYMWYPFMVFNWQLLNVKGRSDLSLRAEIIKKIGAFSILLVSIPWGMNAICWGLLAYSLFDMFTISFFVRRIYQFDLRREIMETFPIGVSSLLMGLLMYVSLRLTSVLVLRLLLGIVVGTLSYSFFCYIFKLREFGFIKQIIRRV